MQSLREARGQGRGGPGRDDARGGRVSAGHDLSGGVAGGYRIGAPAVEPGLVQRAGFDADGAGAGLEVQRHVVVVCRAGEVVAQGRAGFGVLSASCGQSGLERGSLRAVLQVVAAVQDRPQRDDIPGGGVEVAAGQRDPGQPQRHRRHALGLGLQRLAGELVDLVPASQQVPGEQRTAEDHRAVYRGQPQPVRFGGTGVLLLLPSLAAG